MMKVPGSSAHFYVQKWQILYVDPIQMEPYFDVTISNPYSWKKILSKVYNMSMFEVISKKSYIFRDILWIEN